MDASKESEQLLDRREGEPRAWEEIEAGRFQPKRIKGSCVGRELG